MHISTFAIAILALIVEAVNLPSYNSYGINASSSKAHCCSAVRGCLMTVNVCHATSKHKDVDKCTNYHNLVCKKIWNFCSAKQNGVICPFPSGTPSHSVPPHSIPPHSIPPHPTPTPSQSPLPAAPSDFQQIVLIETNKYRALHSAPALTWSTQLADAALANAQTCGFEHTANNIYGENLAAGTGNSPAYYVWLWYSEIKNWDFQTSTGTGVTGHFTQLVWQSTTQMGCAWVTTCANSPYGAYHLVCEYSPPGNFNNLYAENVKSPSSTSVTEPPFNI